jgi:hypothetical protein|tara:strand:- start:41353 stop:41775 length:423 start_codon:yes stop_codon:yes gene_type:complete
MIHELVTNELVIYTQELRDAKDDVYKQRKVQKDRKKAAMWLRLWLDHQEIYLTWEDDNGNDVSSIASTTCEWEEPPMFPTTPMSIEIIHGEEVEEDQYIRFYQKPSVTPTAVHIDKIKNWVTTNNDIKKLSEIFGKNLYA